MGARRLKSLVTLNSHKNVAFLFHTLIKIGFHCTEFEVFVYVTTVAMKILMWVKKWGITVITRKLLYSKTTFRI